jgi:hypothetical protein
MPARRIGSFLNGLPEALVRRAQQAAFLQRAYSEISPPALLPVSRVGALSAGRLTLFADSGPVAAKLKQVSPNLLLRLQKRGLEVNLIEVRVQVRARPDSTPAGERNARKISDKSLDQLESLAQGLSPSPLREALESLLAHQGRKPPKKSGH